MYRKNRRYYFILILCSICTALALTMNFAPVAEGMQQGIYPDIKNGFGGTAFTATLLSGLLIWCNYRIDCIKRNKLHVEVVCFFFAIVWLMGESFALDNTLSALYSSCVQCLKSLIYVVGSTYLLIQLAYLLRFLLDASAIEGRDLPQKETWLIRQYRNHPFGCPLVVFLLGLFPQLLFSYPARMYFDTEHQLLEYFGFYPFSAHHPPASTWLMGKVVSLGLHLGNGSRAVFLYITLQYLLLAIISAYLVYTIRIYFHAPRWLQMITMFITVCAPYHAAYVGMMVKDVIYAYVILLMEIEVLYMLHSDFMFWESKRHCILFWLAASLSILLRNNGKYVVYPTMVMLLITMFSKIIGRGDRRERIKCFFLILAVVVSVAAISGSINDRYGVEKGSIREALSLPFQQTARYLKEYGMDVTEEEREAISRVLDYENLAKSYDPEISDAVKGTYRRDASGEDLQAYFKVWIKQFFRHPTSYIKATLNQNYFLFSPHEEVYAYEANKRDTNSEQSERLFYNLGIHEAEGSVFQMFSKLQELYVKTVLVLPIWGMTSNIAVYNILLVYLLVFSIGRRFYRTLLAALPLLMSLLIVIAAPVVLPRYAFPIMYPMPAVLAFYLYEVKEKSEYNPAGKAC